MHPCNWQGLIQNFFLDERGLSNGSLDQGCINP